MGGGGLVWRGGGVVEVGFGGGGVYRERVVRKRKSWGSSVRSGSVVSGADGVGGWSSRSSMFGVGWV